MKSLSRSTRIAMLAACAVLASLAGSTTASATSSPGDIQTSHQRGADYIRTLQNLTTGEIPGFGGDWSISALAAAGVNAADVHGPAVGDPAVTPPSLQDFYLNTWTGPTWKGNPTFAATDYERATLLAHSAGLNPAKLAADQNLIAQLAGLWAPSTGTFGSASLLNGQMFALLSLGRTKTPKAVIARIVNYMRQHVHADGGFTFSTVSTAANYNSSGDVDMTGAALGAFCEAGVPRTDPIVVNGLNYLRGRLVDSTGAFNALFGVNTDSNAWAVSGLNACGVDAQGADFTTPSGKTPVDFLISQQNLPSPATAAYGSYRYQAGTAANLNSTQTAVRALAGGVFAANPPARANPSDPTLRPDPVVAPGSLVPIALSIDDGSGTLRFCKVTTGLGATVAQVVEDAQTTSFPVGCVSELTRSGNAITSINGSKGNGSGSGWKVSLDQSAEAAPGATPIALGQSIALRLEKPVVEFGTQPQSTVGPVRSFKFFGIDQNRSIRDVALDGANADDFMITQDTCSNATLRIGIACSIKVRFVPSSTGAKTAQLRVPGAFTTDPTYTLNGTGGVLPAGATGATGSTGEAGTAGATGETGSTGATGATGSDGATGSNGANGATGATGSNGANGATGPIGSNGSNGAPGLKGDTGAPGAAGAQGPAGRNATVKCKTVKVKGKKRLRCDVSFVKASSTKNTKATLLRGSRVYASGTTNKLTATRSVPSGTYVLVLQRGSASEVFVLTVRKSSAGSTIGLAG